MEDQENSKMSPSQKLVLFPVPLQGHINPMIQLARILHFKGFRITIIHTKFNSIDESKYPQFTFHLIPDGLSEDETSTSDLVLLLKRLNITLVNPFREILSFDPSVTCLITDALWYFTQDLANNLNLPRIVFRTSSASCFLAYNSLPLFRDKGYLPKKESQLDEKVMEFPPLRVKDIPTSKTADPEDLYWVINQMMETTKAASGLVFNSCKELEDQELTKLGQEFGIAVFSIGPLHSYFPASSSSILEQDQTAISWLDSQTNKSVIYVSFGSVAEMNETQLEEVAWGLANSMQSFLWVIRPGLVQNSQQVEISLPDGFLEAVKGRGKIVKWAPQQEVLAHSAIGCFWTHCGWNSTLESICEGIPMICSPFLADQSINARYVNDVWRIGIQLEKGLDREEIGRAIRKLMVDKEGEEIRGRMASLKEKIDFRLKNDGYSCQCLQGFVHYIFSLQSC